MNEDLLKTFNYFITRDLIYILSGGTLMLSTLHFYDRLPPHDFPTAAFIFSAGIAHVIGYAVQELFCLTRLCSTAPKDTVWQWVITLFNFYEGRDFPKGENASGKFRTLVADPNNKNMGEFQRIITLRMISTAMAPSLLISAIPLLMRWKWISQDSFDWALGLIAILLGFILWVLGWLKAAQMTSFLYEFKK